MDVVRQLVRSAMAATLPRRWFVVSGPRRSGAVCLTFDDGPHPEHTPRVLGALRDAGVPATFFVIGERAERYPDLLRRIVADGHVVGHHTYCHTDPRRTSAGQMIEEVRRTRAVLERVIGAAPILFRPPHGKLTPLKLARLWREGLAVVLWNVDPRDYARVSQDDLRLWFRGNPLTGGDIVLLHDNQPHGAGALSELIETTRDRGLTFTTPLNWNGTPPAHKGN
jgi:peptidoglycan/xylan/chitin deacetylase (PgdA/CDA1 family)